MTIKEFFKKYATVSNIVKVWNAGITKEKVDGVGTFIGLGYTEE